MDNQTFTKIDAMLFTRLHWGELGPVRFRLSNGESHEGEVTAVARAGATGELRNALRGEVCVTTAQGPIRIAYDTIEAIE